MLKPWRKPQGKPVPGFLLRQAAPAGGRVGESQLCTQERRNNTMRNDKKRKVGAPQEAILHTSAQVRLAKEDIFFGPGKAMLMEYIEKTGSMQEACLEMGLSYSKGAKMIKMAEKQLGYRLLERRIGGSGGGGSRLTEEGRDLLRKYRQLTRRVQEDADRAFEEIFGNAGQA